MRSSFRESLFFLHQLKLHMLAVTIALRGRLNSSRCKEIVGVGMLDRAVKIALPFLQIATIVWLKEQPIVCSVLRLERFVKAISTATL